MITKKDFMRLESLLFLNSVLKSKSKRATAEELNTSMDTINKYLSDLEKELGTPLLNSNGRGSVLAPEAHQVAEISKKLEHLLQELNNLSNQKTQIVGKVRLGLTEGVASCLFPYNIMDFYQNNPQIELEVIASDSRINMNIMEVDVNIANEPPSGADLVQIARTDMKCGLFASREYVSRYGVPKDVDDLVNNHKICHKGTHAQNVSNWKKIISKAKHVVCTTNSTYALRTLIESGAGIGLAPLSFNTQHLVAIDTIKLDFIIPLYLIAHKDSKDIPKIRVLLEYTKDLINRL